jgi:hypothetical protein
MSKFGTGMVPNEHQSTLNPPLLLCPTSTIELLNPIKYFRANNIILKPPSSEKPLPNFAP